MYLEEQLRKLEERVAILESREHVEVDPHVGSRLDAIENACQELMDSDDKLSDRCSESDRRTSDLSGQLEVLLDQFAELESRSGQVDLSPVEHRLGRIESELEKTRPRYDRWDQRLAEIDKAAAALAARLSELDGACKGLVGRIPQIDAAEIARQLTGLQSAAQELRASDARLVEQILEVARCAEESMARGEKLEQGSRALETRQTTLDRDHSDVRKEVAWLRDRPQDRREDAWARLLAGGGLAAAIVAIVLFLWPWETIKARRFLVLGDGGRAVAELGSNQSSGSLRLHTPKGSPQVVVSAKEDQSHIGLFDPAGAERLRLSVDSTGPDLVLCEPDQTQRVRLMVGDPDNGLRVYDPVGRLRAGVGLSPDGAAVNLFDPAEQRRVVLCSGDETAALSFLGRKEVQRTTLGMTAKDESILNIHDVHGKQRVLLYAGDKDAGLQVLDRETNVLFSGP